VAGGRLAKANDGGVPASPTYSRHAQTASRANIIFSLPSLRTVPLYPRAFLLSFSWLDVVINASQHHNAMALFIAITAALRINGRGVLFDNKSTNVCIYAHRALPFASVSRVTCFACARACACAGRNARRYQISVASYLRAGATGRSPAAHRFSLLA